MEASLMNTHTMHTTNRLVRTVTRETAHSTSTLTFDRKQRRTCRLCRVQTMKMLFWFGLPILLLMPVVALAQSDFDGTWKIDLNKSSMPDKPEVFLLQGGNYRCKTCVPTINVKADGEDHRVAKNPYYDTISVKVPGDQGVEITEKQQGNAVGTSRMIVSPDGSTATVEFTDSGNPSSDPFAFKETLIRIGTAKRPHGSHAISGSWRISKLESVSDSGFVLTFKVDGDSLNMTTPSGQSYTAKLDGTEAAYKGSSGINGVSVRRLGKDTVEETDRHDGKAIRVIRIMVDPSNTNTMEMIVTDNLRGASTLFLAHKQ